MMEPVARATKLVVVQQRDTLIDLLSNCYLMMKKTDKKIDNALREALTQVCESALASIDGFVWLTHLVNYNDFPRSLNIVCVFETDEQLLVARKTKTIEQLYCLIDTQLRVANIVLKQSARQVSFDTEEACERSHDGRWNERLKRLNLQ